MTPAETAKELSIRRFLIACALDFQMLAGLVEDAREVIGESSSTTLRDVVLAAIGDLLRKGLIEAGFPSNLEEPRPGKLISPEDLDRVLQAFSERRSQGWEFHKWPGDPDEVFRRIQSGWMALDREPGWNDVCWFRATPAGTRRAEELRNGQR